jgi:hypothetical protein
MCALVAAPIESMVNARYLRTLPTSGLRENVLLRVGGKVCRNRVLTPWETECQSYTTDTN